MKIFVYGQGLFLSMSSILKTCQLDKDEMQRHTKTEADSLYASSTNHDISVLFMIIKYYWYEILITQKILTDIFTMKILWNIYKQNNYAFK